MLTLCHHSDIINLKLTPCHYLISKGMIFMPTTTFENLPDAKKKTIIAALLKEFSQSPLSKAQIAPIVKEAQIARGAFYKYFVDLTDAYTYLYRQAMKDIHINISHTSVKTAQDYVNQVREFLTKSQNSSYYNLIKMHTLYNEHFLSANLPKQMPANIWAIAELCHATIRDCLVDPNKQEEYIANLETILTKIIS